jgi:hypothetical protein
MAELNQEDVEVEIPGEERTTPEQIREEQIKSAKQQTKRSEQSDSEFDIQVEDDTPPSDRDRSPLPPEMVKELDEDELTEYSDKVKLRLSQMKKVWHDERRAKEAADRERAEAIAFAQKILEENKKLKGTVNNHETALISSYKETAARNLDIAKREYREAYEAGDAEKIVEAQEKLTAAKIRAEQTERFKPNPVQEQEEIPAQLTQRTEVPRPDPKVAAWHERNPWFGQDRLMTSLALGLHEELVATHGEAYATTDEYYSRIDKLMRDKFPEQFSQETKTQDGGGKPVQRTEVKPATVVAPASRSTSPKKIVLKKSELDLAKRFGLTPEQYALEKIRLENLNG